MTARYTGWLKRGENGTVEARITDEWGWSIDITGTFDESSRTYRLDGVLGEPPEKLRVAALDDAS